ncbi:MAG: hypothetical protein HW416_3437, partial [Chloroflexi bacterium]|nr:hypothetical protein [Chloroflexota bacterium]
MRADGESYYEELFRMRDEYRRRVR